MSKTTEKTVRVLVFREGNLLVAQCLEFNIAAQAKTMDQLKTAFAGSFLAYEALARETDTDVFATLPQAPKKYWDLFAKAETLKEQQKLTRNNGQRVRANRRPARTAQYAAVL